MARGLGSAVYLAKVLLYEVLGRGGVAVDATVGKGNDTLFLANLVGPSGRVYAFDVQAEALSCAKSLLEKSGVAGWVRFIRAGHEDMKTYVREPVDVVMYNLGYLPGGDRSIVTRPQTTLASLKAALDLLRPGGRISLVIYTGHPGGREEYEAILKFVSELDGARFQTVGINFLNRASPAPAVIIIEKAGATDESQAAEENP